MATSCLESRSEPSNIRTCHECGYLLIGLPEPARCPECATIELSQDAVRSGHRACRWWRVAFLGPFVHRRAAENLWKIALHPALRRTSRGRRTLIVSVSACAVLTAALLCNWWVYKIPTQPGDGTYTQRCWWYEVPRRAAPPLVSHGRTPGGEPLVYHYSLGASGRQVPLRVFSIATGGQVFHFALDMFSTPWVFIVLAWPLLCAVVLRIKTRRGFRMAGLLCAAFVPFLVFIPVLFAAKMAFMFFWIDWRVIQYLFFMHLVLALWPGLTYVRYAMLAGSTRSRGYVCAGVTCLVTVLWPIATHGAFLLTEDYAMGWI